ncbi:unnamed protein product [Closterium sp. Naga37s-1]|nr:unnamed protein product [Closterium sp. Naga37s-1]
MRTPSGSSYLATAASFSAAEHRGMMQIMPLIAHLPEREDIARATVLFSEWYAACFRVDFHTDESLVEVEALTTRVVEAHVIAYPKQRSEWRLVKVHLLSHLSATIRDRGMPLQYSTNLYEHTHKTTVKRPARGGNWRNATERIVQKHVQLAAAKELARESGGDAVYVTAMHQATEGQRRVLTRTSRRLLVGDTTDRCYSEYLSQLGHVALAALPGALRAARVTTRTLYAHTALAIPPHNRMEWTSRGQFVKATPAQPLFSHIAIAARRNVWYGQCLILFHFMDSAGMAHERAFVRYYDEEERCCPATGCKRLSPTVGENAFSVIELDSILSLAHIVRDSHVPTPLPTRSSSLYPNPPHSPPPSPLPALSGAAKLIVRSACTASRCIINANSAFPIFTSPSSGPTGGQLTLVNLSFVGLTGGVFRNVQATINVTGCEFANNTAPSGGVLSDSFPAAVTPPSRLFSKCTFRNNTRAIVINGESPERSVPATSFVSCVFRDNSAPMSKLGLEGPSSL